MASSTGRSPINAPKLSALALPPYPRRHADPCKQLSFPWLRHPGRRGLARRPRPANDQWRCGVCGFSQRRQRNAGLLQRFSRVDPDTDKSP